MTTATCTFRSLGLTIGGMFAVITDQMGQPVVHIERIDQNDYHIVTTKTSGEIYEIKAKSREPIPDVEFIGMVVRELGLPAEEAEAGMLRMLNRCEGHRRRRLWRIQGLTFIQPERSWYAGDGVVVVDALLFDAAWAHDDDYYVGHGGTGGKSASVARYRGFIRWLNETNGKKPIEMSEVSLGAGRRNGVPQFTNGRHRFAVLRDMGRETLPVSCDVYSQMDIKRLYGAE